MTVTTDIADRVTAELIDGKWRVPRQEIELRQFIGDVVLCTVFDKIPPPINVPFMALLENVTRQGSSWLCKYEVIDATIPRNSGPVASP